MRRRLKTCGATGLVCGCSLFIVAFGLLLYGSVATAGGQVGTHVAGAPDLTLDVKEPLGVARRQWPISAGVPLAPGLVHHASQLRMTSGRTPVPLQTHVLSRWPDHSVRWVLLDWQADLKAGEQRRFRVTAGTPATPPRPIRIVDRKARVEVDTGPLQLSVPKSRFAILSDVRLSGHPVTGGRIVSFFNIDGKRIAPQAPDTVAITEHGPLRVRLTLRGHYASGFDYVVRIDAFAGQPFVRVFHSFEQHGPRPYTPVRQIGIEVPMQFHGAVAYSAGREKGRPFTGTVSPSGFTLFQEDNATMHVGGVARAGHAAGWVDLHDGTHGIALAARFFWQEYPQSFQLREDGLTYSMWAPQAPPAKVGMGAAKTHEVVLYLHGKKPPPPAMLAVLGQPVLARVNPQWIVASGALRNSVAPTAATVPFLRRLREGYRRYQTQAARERWDDSGEVHCPDPAHERPRRGFFGMFNWGDWNFPGYHDTIKGCDAWGNLEYDLTQVLALAYAATGERAYYMGMVTAARHFMDVDRIHYQRDRPKWVGMNHPKNPLHFSFELGGVDLGHTWTEGLLSYYALTGDERGLEAARGIADYLAFRSRTVQLGGNPRQWGWPQIALVAAYEATGNEAYKNAARAYARRSMAVYRPNQVEHWKMGILAEGLSYTYSIFPDPAIRKWLIAYASAVTASRGVADPRFVPAVAYVARLTGREKYARLAAATVSRLQFSNWGKPLTIAGRIGFRILSLVGAHPHKH
ncbi:MAG: beta-L-arabinofuranosidase domain-containing protein [Candidatus Binatia bacterium]